jgi:hypothetical protein
MASDERVRIEIGFEGGQILNEHVAAAAADGLEAALREGSAPVHELAVEDGRYVIALGRVLYVKRHLREQKVGF